MSDFEVVTGIVVAFFVIGIIVGVIAVVAMSAIRTDRAGRTAGQAGPSDTDGAGWEEPPGPEQDDRYPRWPAGSAD